MSRKPRLWFGELYALVNQLCFLFSARLAIILLIIVLKLGSQTENCMRLRTRLGWGKRQILLGFTLGSPCQWSYTNRKRREEWPSLFVSGMGV